jgi:hypothetical protein
VIPTVRLFHPHGPDRVAVISVQPTAATPEAFNIQVSRGPRRNKLSAAVAYGPYPRTQLEQRHREALAKLIQEGFVRAGVPAMLDSLQSSQAPTRARAARRLGWYRETSTVPALLQAAALQGTDLSSIIDALGRIGDPRAVEVCRTEASRKLLSRRRSGVEALRNLNDAAGLDDAEHLALDRLPQTVRDALHNAQPTDTSATTVAPISQAVRVSDAKDIGLALDSLYELATPLAVAVVVDVIANINLAAPYNWRYVKSILKRSMLRGDHATFGWLLHRIERVGHKAAGTTATVKSGLDGQQKSMPIFRRGTQKFLKKAAWRHLTRLATHRPHLYTFAAAECLAAYKPEDAKPTKGVYDDWARAYVFHRVLRNESPHWFFVARSMMFRAVSKKKAPTTANERTESWPELWDQYPAAYLILLAKSTVAEVLMFALHGIKKSPEVLHLATHTQVLAMLHAPHDDVVALASAELERRFDASKPDWSLIDALIADARPVARTLGQRFLALTAPQWTKDIERTMTYLGASDAGVRSVAAGLVTAALDECDTWYRRELTERILGKLQTPEPTPGAHEGYARVARDGLADDLANVLNLDELMAMVSKGSPAAQAVGATVMGKKPEALKTLGMPRVVLMAQHELAAVRESARAMIRGALADLKADPSPLFTLAECEWEDTRKFAFELIRDHMDLKAMGIDGYVGLCDSNRDDVQTFGREVVLRDIAALDMGDLIARLSQHPAARIRRFALDLVVGHLRDGFVALAKLENFFRTALFDLWPSRIEKNTVVDFLLKRGLKDERQAEVACRVLGDFVRVKSKRDFENALEALVRLKLAFPEVESRATMVVGGAA